MILRPILRPILQPILRSVFEPGTGGEDLRPKNTVAPSIVGTVEIGETVESDTGTWTDADSISYVWSIGGVDVGDPDDDLDIPNDPSLQLQTLTLRVTATNTEGSRSRSVSQQIALTLAPINVTPAAVTGDAEVDAVLTATPGAWSFADSVSGEWYSGATPTGETGLTYTVQEADEGEDITYVEEAANSIGSTQQASNAIEIPGGLTLTEQLQTRFASANWLGGMYDFSDMDAIYALSDGTGAVAVNGTIGYVSDKSGNSKPAVQATAASRPRFGGAPSTLGAELVVNSTFATDTDWTKGAGWTISGGSASKTAGTASDLSQTIAVSADKRYVITYDITRSAGTLTAKLVGSTTVSSPARSYRGSWLEVVYAPAGTVAITFTADSAFAGTLKNVSVREVTAVANVGAVFDAADDFLQAASMNLSATDKVTIVASIQQGQSSAAAVVAEHGNYNGNLTGSAHIIMNAGWLCRARGASGSGTVTAEPARESPTTNTYQSNVITATTNFSGADLASQLSVRVRGVASSQTTGGASVSASAAANSVFTLGKPFTNNFRFGGTINRCVLIGGAVDADGIALAEAWAKEGMACCAQIGDSTVSVLNSPAAMPQAMPIHSLVGGMVTGAADLSKAGDRISHQKTAWSGLDNKDALQAVFVQVGLNDVKGRVGENTATAADVIADLQDLIDTINADKPTGCKTYICGMTPCKAWLDTATNPSAAYAAWLAVNDAIAGGGATPITGVDGRVTSHVSALDDGGGYLKPEYDMDGVHENNAARFVIAQAWREQLVSDGLVDE